MEWPVRPEGHTPDVTGDVNEPWWTRDAITWLDGHLTKKMVVVEWGAGASTIWLAQRVRALLTIEHDKEWAGRVHAALRDTGCDPTQYYVVHRPLGEGYYQRGQTGDVAIVDGRLRVFCCETAMRLLYPGGFLVLDNAERVEYAEVHELLADWPVQRFDNGLWRTDIWTKP